MKKRNLLEKLNSSLMAILFLAMSTMVFTACDDSDGDADEDPTPAPENSILEIVAASENHTQLEAFVTADADLTSALEGDDLTLFAPNDDAFNKLRTILGVESLDQVNPEVIAAVLRFHAHTSVVLREDITSSSTLGTVQGENITFNADGNIATGGSDENVEFVGDEILATNGVVHVVETILIPPSIFEFIRDNLNKVSQPILLGADFTHLRAAIEYADDTASLADADKLVTILSDENASYTVFAPGNGVFETAAGDGTVEQFIQSFSRATMRNIILHHVIAQNDLGPADLTADAPGITTFETALSSSQMTFTLGFVQGAEGSGDFTDIFIDSNGDFTGQNTEALDAEIAVAPAYDAQQNGIVHAIAGLLVPPMP